MCEQQPRGTVLHVEPNVALLDEPVHVWLDGLPAGERVKVSARMCDHLGQTWESHAVFQADAQGMVDLQTACPLSGTYDEADGLGLLWSMERTGKGTPDGRNSLDPVNIEWTAEVNGIVRAEAVSQRLFMAPSVVSEPLREQGLIGTFFYPKGEGPYPAVIVLGGSEGGLNVRRASLLASHGFAALALAYFGMEGLPKHLVNIPIEYVERAIDWLLTQPLVRKDRLAMIGTSKGAELALVCASYFPKITAVVGYVPSAYVYAGLGPSLDGTKPSSWSYQGVPLPFATTEPRVEILAELSRSLEAGEPVRYRDWYASQLEDYQKSQQAIIQVEKIKGDVLLISGEVDQLWPSDCFARQVMERLQEHQHPHHYEHFQYEGAGHAIGIPFNPTAGTEVSPYPGGALALGGSAKANHRAQADAWPKMITFLRNSLAKE